jgi:hypothetical protein
MVEPLSLQLVLAQRLSRILQTIPAQHCLTPPTVPYRLRWGRSPEAISYVCDFDPDLPLHHCQSLASMILAGWHNCCIGASVSWPQITGSHCRLEILPSGQILFTPAPLLLGVWLWQLATTNKDLQVFPQVGLKVSPPSPDPGLAECLQLSLEAVVYYTHGRCRQLLAIPAAKISPQPSSSQVGQSTYPAFVWTAQSSPQPVDQGYGLKLNLKRKGRGDGSRAMDLCHHLYPIGYDQAVLRGLVKLVDCLTLAPLVQGGSLEPHRLNAAYGLSVAIDRWLGHRKVSHGVSSTIFLLRGIDRALAAALSAMFGSEGHP